MTTPVSILLGQPQMRKIAIFGWFNEYSTITTKRLNIGGEGARPSTAQRSIGELSFYQRSSKCVPDNYGEDAEQLGHIVDERLLLFDVTELAYTYEMSNDEFWEAIERL
jgi:hypothetical protein